MNNRFPNRNLWAIPSMRGEGERERGRDGEKEREQNKDFKR
jgi:hypothetical protein